MKMKIDIVQSSLRTDVTSLLLFGDYILSGMGGIISLFSLDSSELLAQVTVFKDFRIHGLYEGSDNFIIAHGGSSVSILCCNPVLPNKLSIDASCLIDDWIQSVQWLEDTNIAIATAHNIVILWNWRRGEKLLTVGCKEKCILYSATFIGKTWDQLVLLAGTVFREVVIWSPARQGNTDTNADVLQRLLGHKGVIFSIHYNSENGQIHTTSDDRSVKGWQVNPCNPSDWKHCNIKEIYTLYGHTARVWKSLRLKNFTLSVGEDSQVCVWSTKGILLKRWSMHQGGNIWSLACSEEKKLMAGFHPREVNCLQKLPSGTKFPLFVSGGEDTTIRVTSLGYERNLYTLAVLHSHISSVKTLTYCEYDEEKFLLFSAGGRAQLKVWELKIENKLDVPEVLCRELSTHMLMECNNKQIKSWKDVSKNIDPETRYMSVCVIPHDNFFIIVGCSDGFLRIFQYCPNQQNLELVKSSDFHHRCILNVASIPPSKIVTMATDGVLAFWSIENIVNGHDSLSHGERKISQNMSLEKDDFQPFSSFKIHQSGVNCFAIHTLECNHILLATGGDDTALVLSVFKLTDNPVSAYLVQQWRMESAHIAQITGIAFVDNYVISTSVDQYIFIWKWICDISSHLLFVNKIAEYYSIITDIHGLNVWHIKNGFSLSVHGKGLESIDVLFVNEEDVVP